MHIAIHMKKNQLQPRDKRQMSVPNQGMEVKEGMRVNDRTYQFGCDKTKN